VPGSVENHYTNRNSTSPPSRGLRGKVRHLGLLVDALDANSYVSDCMSTALR
jgi:hypothetical protein